MFMSDPICAYCGRPVLKAEKEHAISRCLYPRGGSPTTQRLTVPACRECNASWADDEVHFRNVLSIAGVPNRPRSELWETSIRRSFEERDGQRRLYELVSMMKPVEGTQEYKVFPAEDPRVLRVVRKIIRGLSYHHEGMVVPDDTVWADIL